MMCGNLLNLFPILLMCILVSQPKHIRHVVQKGESLWQISKQYQVPVERLVRLNPAIKDPNVIFPGQIINVA